MSLHNSTIDTMNASGVGKTRGFQKMRSSLARHR